MTDDREDDRPSRVPMSVFFRGRRQSRRTNSFRPTHETQATIERERHKRTNQSRRVVQRPTRLTTDATEAP
jgi:hypothetical protein